MIERMYILCLIIIIKSEVWTITHCIGLGHETMVSAACLFMFLLIISVYFCINLYTNNCDDTIGNRACRLFPISHIIMDTSSYLTHWGRVTLICVSKLTIIGWDNGLSPDRRQAIIWTIAGILSIGPSGTTLSEILIAIQIFSFKKMHLKMSSGKWRPSCCLGLNVLKMTYHLHSICS